MKTILLCPASKTTKKRSERTLCASCSKVEPKNYTPPQTHFPGARDSENLISWRWSLPLPTNPVWWGSMNAISSYHGNRPTHPPTNTARLPAHCKQTGPITIHCAAASAQCNQVTANVSAQWCKSHTVHVVNTMCCPWAGLFCLIRREFTTFVWWILHVPRSQLRRVHRFIQEMMYRCFFNAYYHSYCSIHGIHTCCVRVCMSYVSGTKIPVVRDCVCAG